MAELETLHGGSWLTVHAQYTLVDPAVRMLPVLPASALAPASCLQV